MPLGLWTQVAQNSVLGGVQISHATGNFEGEEWPNVKYKDSLP